MNEETTKKLKEMEQQMESLDSINAILKPVVTYANQLFLIPQYKQTNEEKLWLLAFENINTKMSSGTEASMIEVLHLIPILFETIPNNN